jgi:L-amino acid N-acyltransferase YncA
MNVTLRKFIKDDWKEVAEIYEQGLLTRQATFETEIPEYNVWIKKFRADLIWVAETNGSIVGWAGLQPVSARKAYEGVMEVTIYVHKDHTGQGIGDQLMKHLIIESENAGIWTLHASIFSENTASIRLHESNGFRHIGFRERIAKLDGHWKDTFLYERRSKVVGV